MSKSRLFFAFLLLRYLIPKLLRSNTAARDDRPALGPSFDRIQCCQQRDDGAQHEAQRRHVREASGVFSGILFGLAATFGASAISMQGTASPDEFWAVSWGALALGTLTWSNLGAGRRRRYIAFSGAAFTMMLLAIFGALGIGPRG